MQKYLGIDISKNKFNVALLKDEKYKHKKFDNNEKGFEELRLWLERLEVKDVHCCMESTGVYGEELAEYLYKLGYKVSVVNPARIKGFSQGELKRTKTDKVDASVIARFCMAMKPELWFPTAKNIKQLQSLVKRIDSLLEMKQQEVNRLDVSNKIVRVEIQEHINYIEERIKQIRKKIEKHIDDDPELRDKKELLESIPGVGEATISLVLSYFAETAKFKSAKKLTSYLGIAPREHQSGSSINKRSKMSKVGNSFLRKSLFMPALVGLKYNPVLIEMKERLTKAGKAKMLIVGAAMRKLVHIIYGVLKNNIPFDPNYHLNNT